MGTLSRMLAVISSFAVILYALQYTSLLQQTCSLVSEHIVHIESNKVEAYAVANRDILVVSTERNNKNDSENYQTKTEVLQTTILSFNKLTSHQHSIASTTDNSIRTRILSNATNATVLALDTKISNTFKDIYHKFFERDRNVKGINCFEVFKGNQSYISKANQLSKTSNVPILYASTYINLTKICESFINGRGYITSHLSEEEKDFPIAYSILMYKDVEQTERLLRAIYRPQNVYCIHVDATSPDNIYRAVVGIANCFENVFLTSKRVNVVWGKMTVLSPELMCMRELWTRNKLWKYFINLTGQEFPLKTNYELVKILKAYNGSNDVESTRKTFKKRWRRVLPTPHGIKPTKGAVHIAVSRGYVDFILHDKRAQDFLKWVSKTIIPDETFFSSLNSNPHLGVPGSYIGYPETTAIANKNKPYLARFKNRGQSILHKWACSGKRVRGICIFNSGDLPALSQRKELFANKFHLAYSPNAYSCMEELIFNRTRDEYLGKLSFQTEWYASLGFVKNKVE